VGTNNLQPLISTPLPDFLKPIFDAYAKSGIQMSLNRVEGDVIFLNVNKKQCGG